VVPEARLEQTDHGLRPAGDGWFVLNARDAVWLDRGPRGVSCRFEGEPWFDQLGVRLFVLEPGQPMSMYHWEDDQEDFLVVDGEALLIVEGEERPLRKWDLVHCPRKTRHVIVGAGGGPCMIFGVGSRTARGRDDWGGYPVEPAAARHDASVLEETNEPDEAYARFPDPLPSRYEGWLD
jgi:uncharacterized cupin superfamily protein